MSKTKTAGGAADFGTAFEMLHTWLDDEVGIERSAAGSTRLGSQATALVRRA